MFNLRIPHPFVRPCTALNKFQTTQHIKKMQKELAPISHAELTCYHDFDDHFSATLCCKRRLYKSVTLPGSVNPTVSVCSTQKEIGYCNTCKLKSVPITIAQTTVTLTVW